MDLKEKIKQVRSSGKMISEEIKRTEEYLESLRFRAAQVSGKAELLEELIKEQESSSKQAADRSSTVVNQI